MSLLVLLNMQKMVIVATSRQPKASLCLSIIADMKKVPDDYLIVGADPGSFNKSLSFNQKMSIYQNMTGDTIKRAMDDTVTFQIKNLFEHFEEDLRSVDKLKQDLGRPFKVSKLPIAEKKLGALPSSVKRPSAGTATGKVWDICDKVMNMQNPPKLPNRDQIIGLCVNAGINASTAATQYGKWKASQ